MPEILNIPDEFSHLLEEYGTKVVTKEGNTYYELPFWFQIVDEGYRMYIELPEDLEQFIVKARLGGHHPQPIRKT